MAIQQIEQRKEKLVKGTMKGIDASAQGMVIDILQSSQYNKPIASAVRESVSNSVDSQKEKERAISILKGESKVEDYFIDRGNDDLYKDSQWDPSYYDLNHLDLNNNKVTLTYIEGEGVGRCDKFVIQDRGVGMNIKRLFKSTSSFGWSTKRNRKDALGAWGLTN